MQSSSNFALLRIKLASSQLPPYLTVFIEKRRVPRNNVRLHSLFHFYSSKSVFTGKNRHRWSLEGRQVKVKQEETKSPPSVYYYTEEWRLLSISIYVSSFPQFISHFLCHKTLGQEYHTLIQPADVKPEGPMGEVGNKIG